MSDQMTRFQFTPDREARFQKLVKKYETKASALLPTLWLAQEQAGFLNEEVMEAVAKMLDLPPRHVVEAVSFYVMYKKKDMGKFCLQVCNNITCHMMGAEKLIKVVRDELGLVAANEVTADGTFSYVPVQCLGSCDTAPVVQVNDDYFENLNPAVFKELIRKLKQGDVPKREELYDTSRT